MEEARALAAKAFRAVLALERGNKRVIPFAAAMVREFESAADWSDADIERIGAKIERATGG